MPQLHTVTAFLLLGEKAVIFCVMVWFGLVCFGFMCSVTHVTLDTSITGYNVYITTQLTIYGQPHNTM